MTNDYNNDPLVIVIVIVVVLHGIGFGLRCQLERDRVGAVSFILVSTRKEKEGSMLELGLSMTLLGFLWFLTSFVLGMWRDGVLFDVPQVYTFIHLGVWVGGGSMLGMGFWLAVVGAVTQLVRAL